MISCRYGGAEPPPHIERHSREKRISRKSIPWMILIETNLRRSGFREKPHQLLGPQARQLICAQVEFRPTCFCCLFDEFENFLIVGHLSLLGEV
jgi:hypothetical protein